MLSSPHLLAPPARRRMIASAHGLNFNFNSPLRYRVSPIKAIKLFLFARPQARRSGFQRQFLL